MSITIPGSVTGSPQTGFVTPGYTNVTDTPPNINAKQVAVTALTGTQVGATIHSVSSPFTGTVFRPQILKSLPAANPITNVVKSIPINRYKVLTRKGALPYAAGTPQMITISTILDIPAGVDTYSPAEIRAATSFHIGMLQALSAGIGDTVVTGVM